LRQQGGRQGVQGSTSRKSLQRTHLSLREKMELQRGEAGALGDDLQAQVPYMRKHLVKYLCKRVCRKRILEVFLVSSDLSRPDCTFKAMFTQGRPLAPICRLRACKFGRAGNPARQKPRCWPPELRHYGTQFTGCVAQLAMTIMAQAEAQSAMLHASQSTMPHECMPVRNADCT